MNETALLIIDVQNGLLEKPELVHEPEATLARIGSLVAGARDHQIPIIFIQHDGAGQGHPLTKPHAGWHIHPATGYQAGDMVIEKRECDAFHNTELQSRLDALGVTTLVVAGMCSDYCVDTTVRRAYSLGYRVILASDAHTTLAKPHMTAAMIVAHHDAILGSGFATSVPTADIRFQTAEAVA